MSMGTGVEDITTHAATVNRAECILESQESILMTIPSTLAQLAIRAVQQRVNCACRDWVVLPLAIDRIGEA